MYSIVAALQHRNQAQSSKRRKAWGSQQDPKDSGQEAALWNTLYSFLTFDYLEPKSSTTALFISEMEVVT